MKLLIEQTKTIRGKQYTISSDSLKLDEDFLFNYLSRAYWCEGRTRETIQKSIQHSLCFGLFENRIQIGFARVLTDYATFAYLADVFILDEYQGNGLGTWLIKTIVEDAGIDLDRGWLLRTRDAHRLYEKFGFQVVAEPEKIMEMRV